MELRIYLPLVAMLLLGILPTKAETNTMETGCATFIAGGPPIAVVCGKTEGKVDRSELLAMKAIELQGCVPSAKLKGFKLSVVRKNDGKEEVFSMESENAELTETMKKFLQKVPAGTKLYFEDFNVQDDRSTKYTLKPVVVMVG